MDVFKVNNHLKKKDERKSERLLTQKHLAKLTEREARKKRLSYKPENIFVDFKKGK